MLVLGSELDGGNKYGPGEITVSGRYVGCLLIFGLLSQLNTSIAKVRMDELEM